MGENIINLKAAIKAANANHQQWAQSQGITPKTVSELIKDGAIVVGTVVYRETNYRVEPRTKGGDV